MRSYGFNRPSPIDPFSDIAGLSRVSGAIAFFLVNVHPQK